MKIRKYLEENLIKLYIKTCGRKLKQHLEEIL